MLSPGGLKLSVDSRLRWAFRVSSLRPNLFIVGAPRCGTTFLHHGLAAHPEIFMTQEKEPHFFSRDFSDRYEAFQGRRIETLIHDENDYLDLFRCAGNECIRGESSVFYLYSEEAPRAIHKFDPQAKIVCMVRDPVALMHSVHAQLLLMGDEDCPSFSRALELEDLRREGRVLPSNVRAPYVLCYSNYAEMASGIKTYRELFGRRQVKIIVLDDLRRSPAKTFHETLDFLGVERIALPDSRTVNSARRPRSLVLNQILRRRLHDGRYRFRGRIYNWMNRLNSRPGDLEPIDSKLRAELVERYRPEVEKLSELTNRNLVRLWGYESDSGA